MCWGKRNREENPGLKVGAEAWEPGEGGAQRASGSFSGPRTPSPPHPLSTPSRYRLLPERWKTPRPREAQRPSSARRSPGEGPGIAAAGKAQEARGARVLSWARGPRGAARRVGCGGGRVALWDWFNVGNLVSKEGAVAEAMGRREGERAPGSRPG